MTTATASAASPARAYGIGTAVSMSLYVLAIVVAEASDGQAWFEGPAGYVVALLPAVAIMGQLWAVMRLIATADEYVRAVTLKRFVAAACLMMAAATCWGFLELYKGLAHLQAWYAYPAFWAFYGLVTPFVRTSRP